MSGPPRQRSSGWTRRDARRRRRAAPCTALAALCIGCAPEPPTPPNVVLIVIDNLRADRLGVYGHGRATSPNIDALARAGTTFTRAFAPSSWTRPSVASLFTSRPPSEHGAVSFERALRDDLPTLAEAFRDAGYHTLGVSGNFVHVSDDTGLARGFDAFHGLSVRLPEAPPEAGSGRADDAGGDVLLRLPAEDGSDAALRAPSAPEVNREVLSRLPTRTERPLFLYVHYMDPHAGYLPPEPFRSALAPSPAGRFPAPTSDYVVARAAARELPAEAELEHMRALYDGEIAATDAAVGRLLAALEERGFAPDAVVAVVSDHGEEFGEHGGLFHGISLHRESLRVPFVVHDARRPSDGVRRDEPVDLLDVAPTLLGLAGIAPPPTMQGRALLSEPSEPTNPRDLVAELHPDPLFEDHLRPRADGVAVMRWPWKVVVGRGGEVRGYRLDRDPEERTPLGPGAIPADLLADARERAHRAAAADVGRPLELGTQRRRELRALGYAE